MELVRERGSQKTICPLEAARALQPDDWRPIMDDTRVAATELAQEGKVQIEQDGNPVDIRNAKGPIRLRLIED